MKEILLVVAMLLWLTDVVQGAGVTDHSGFMRTTLRVFAILTEAKIAPCFDSATWKARQQRALYGALTLDCHRIPAKKLGAAAPNVRLICPARTLDERPMRAAGYQYNTIHNTTLLGIYTAQSWRNFRPSLSSQGSATNIGLQPQLRIVGTRSHLKSSQFCPRGTC
jgi:hypothetical protein